MSVHLTNQYKQQQKKEAHDITGKSNPQRSNFTTCLVKCNRLSWIWNQTLIELKTIVSVCLYRHNVSLHCFTLAADSSFSVTVGKWILHTFHVQNTYSHCKIWSFHSTIWDASSINGIIIALMHQEKGISRLYVGGVAFETATWNRDENNRWTG